MPHSLPVNVIAANDSRAGIPAGQEVSPRPIAIARRAIVITIAALPLLVWPGLDQPFSAPKLWVLAAAVIAFAPIAWLARARRPVRPHGGREPASQATLSVQVAGQPEVTSDRAITSLHWIAGCWMASWIASALLGDVVSLEVLLLALATAGLAIEINAIAPDPVQLAAAHVIGATVVAIIAVLQWGGIDPFAIAGWIAPLTGASPRLRVYATLGNPNFVSALLTATMPLTIALLAVLRGRGLVAATNGSSGTHATAPRSDGANAASAAADAVGAGATVPGTVVPGAGARVPAVRAAGAPVAAAPAARAVVPLAIPLLIAALGVQFVGILATGSRAAALGLIAAALTWILLDPPGRRSQRARIAVTAAVAALVVIGASTARPLRETLAGRVYIWRVVWPHALEAPWAGYGPGAFQLLYPSWERATRRTMPRREAFPGPQQHAHNDYLEALVERGLAGPVTILAVLTTCVRRGWRRRRDAGAAVPSTALAPTPSPLALGAAATMTALGAIACVDFPLARPAEALLFWSVIVLAGLGVPRQALRSPASESEAAHGSQDTS